MRQLTKTELEAYTARKAFHLKIELAAEKVGKAAALAAVAPPLKSIAPEAMPAETDPPPVVVLRSEPRSLGLREVILIVADVFGVRVADLKGPRRHHPITLPRQVAMMLCKEFAWSYSYPAIGRVFGGRDHTTVMYAVNVAPFKVAADEKLREKVDAIRAKLSEISLIPIPESPEPPEPPKEPSIAERYGPRVTAIQRIVATYFNIPTSDLLAKNRELHVSEARKVAYYVTREYTALSYSAIALRFGGRNHSSVMQGVSSVAARMMADQDYCHDVATVLTAIERV